MQVESPQISSTSPSATVEGNENSRRLDNSLLDKSLEELIKANRSDRKSQKNQKRKPQASKKQPGNKPQNGGVKKFTIQELRAGRKPAADQPQRNKAINKTAKNVPRNTPGIRQPWEKPISLPAAPLPAQPLKISIRNELAERSNSSQSMDWSSTSPSSSHHAARYSSRDRVEGRKEYRIGSRDAAQPMNIDYDYNRRY